MEPWFGLATLLDLVCGILWAKDAREAVPRHYRVGQCQHKLELYLQKNDPLYAAYGCSWTADREIPSSVELAACL
jgi:hypothetical protein